MKSESSDCLHPRFEEADFELATKLQIIQMENKALKYKIKWL